MDVPPPELFSLPGGLARVEWRRSRRAKRVSLRIDPRHGAVVVTLPMQVGRRAGTALLMTHADWVSDRLAALPECIRFADGAELPLGGIPHRIRHLPGGRGGAWLEGTEIVVSGLPEFVARRVGDFLRAEARRRLSAALAPKIEASGLRPARVTVKDTKTRWGSCAPDGSLAFSWRLVMAPGFVLDYVAAHELAHLRHMNHGQRFWALTRELTAHTDAAVSWLHGEGARLLRIG